MPSLKSLPSDRAEHKSKIPSNTSRHLAEGKEVARFRLWFFFVFTRHFYSARDINSTDSEWRLWTLKSSVRKARGLCTRILPRVLPSPRNGNGRTETGTRSRVGSEKRSGAETREGTQDGDGDGSGVGNEDINGDG